jgi:hypothetical protein
MQRRQPTPQIREYIEAVMRLPEDLRAEYVESIGNGKVRVVLPAFPGSALAAVRRKLESIESRPADIEDIKRDLDRLVRNNGLHEQITIPEVAGPGNRISEDTAAAVSSVERMGLKGIVMEIIQSGDSGMDVSFPKATTLLRKKTRVTNPGRVLSEFVDNFTIYEYNVRGINYLSLKSPKERAADPSRMISNVPHPPFNRYRSKLAIDILEVLAKKNVVMTKNELLRSIHYPSTEWDFGRILFRMVNKGYLIMVKRDPITVSISSEELREAVLSDRQGVRMKMMEPGTYIP